MWWLWNTLLSLAGIIVYLNSIAFKVTFIYFVHVCMHEHVCMSEYMCICVSVCVGLCVSQACMWRAEDNCGNRKPYPTMWVPGIWFKPLGKVACTFKTETSCYASPPLKTQNPAALCKLQTTSELLDCSTLCISLVRSWEDRQTSLYHIYYPFEIKMTLRYEIHLNAKDSANKELKTYITLLTRNVNFLWFSNENINRRTDENRGSQVTINWVDRGNVI